MVRIEVGEAESSDVGQSHTGAVEAFGKRARAGAGVYEQHAGRRAEDRCVSSRAAGKDAEFQ